MPRSDNKSGGWRYIGRLKKLGNLRSVNTKLPKFPKLSNRCASSLLHSRRSSWRNVIRTARREARRHTLWSTISALVVTWTHLLYEKYL